LNSWTPRRVIVMNDWQRAYGLFSRGVLQRLRVGAEVYGDKFFDRPPVELIDEIEAELLDVCGWGFILWSRLETTKKKIEEVER